MKTRALNIYATTNATTNAVAQIVIPRPGLITAIMGCVWVANAAANSSSCLWEISFSSAAQSTSNDAVGPIYQISLNPNFTTSGNANMVSQNSLAGIAIPVRENDRLYAHLVIAGTAITNYFRAFIYVAE